jgi:catechol 2,3-dioxygenase-like lactoylglutathione lyase family enzyme
MMVTFSGVDHVGFSVTDLDRSERFYTDVFDLVRVMDFG